MCQQADRTQGDGEKVSRARRKLYATPKLIAYGAVEKLTQSGGQSHPDGSGGSKKVGRT